MVTIKYNYLVRVLRLTQNNLQNPTQSYVLFFEPSPVVRLNGFKEDEITYYSNTSASSREIWGVTLHPVPYDDGSGILFQR